MDKLECEFYMRRRPIAWSSEYERTFWWLICVTYCESGLHELGYRSSCDWVTCQTVWQTTRVTFIDFASKQTMVRWLDQQHMLHGSATQLRYTDYSICPYQLYRIITVLTDVCYFSTSRRAKYCDQCFCVFVCASVCPLTYMYLWNQKSKDRAYGSGDMTADRQTDTHTDTHRRAHYKLRNRCRGRSKIVV